MLGSRDCYGLPQVDMSTDHVYIEIPKGFEFEVQDKGDLRDLSVKVRKPLVDLLRLCKRN
jgi:hypothetical protein